MNKVVTSRMLAADLPEKARGDIDPGHTVEVTVAEVVPPSTPKRMLSELVGAMPPAPDTEEVGLAGWIAKRPALGTSAVTVAEAVERVRELRDERDD